MAAIAKTYTFVITAEVMDSETKKLFDAHVKYENMAYEDVVLVEKNLIGMFENLNKFAEAQVAQVATPLVRK